MAVPENYIIQTMVGEGIYEDEARNFICGWINYWIYPFDGVAFPEGRPPSVRAVYHIPSPIIEEMLPLDIQVPSGAELTSKRILWAMVENIPSYHLSENDAVKMAIDGLENNMLFVTEPYAHLLENTAPANPIYVKSIGNESPKFPSYYLVPFVRNGRTLVIVEVNAEVGGFMAAFDGSENGLAKYPMVSSDEALEIVRKAIENIGPLQNAKLVWKPCEQSWGPVYPSGLFKPMVKQYMWDKMDNFTRS